MKDYIVGVKIMYWGSKGGGARFAFELSRGISEIKKTYCSLSARNELLSRFQELPLEVEVKEGAPHSVHEILYYIFFGILDYIWCWRQRSKVDVVIFPMVYSVVIFHIVFYRIIGKRTIFIVHDFIPHLGEKNFLIEASIKLSVFFSSDVFVLSEAVKEDVKRFWLTKSKKVKTVPLPPFSDYEISTKESKARDCVNVLFFGRLVDYKGLNIFLEAAEIIGLKHKFIKFFVVGSGDLEPYNQILKKNYSFIVLDNRWVQDFEVNDIINQADIVVCPYLEATQSGIVPISQFLGKITVVTPVGGLVEQVAGGTGIILKNTDTLSLVRFFEDYISAPGEFEEVRERSRRKFNKHSWIDFGQALIDGF